MEIKVALRDLNNRLIGTTVLHDDSGCSLPDYFGKDNICVGDILQDVFHYVEEVSPFGKGYIAIQYELHEGVKGEVGRRLLLTDPGYVSREWKEGWYMEVMEIL